MVPNIGSIGPLDVNYWSLDGLKFDLRLYVVVTSCQPLTIFLHKEGLARFATQKYSNKTNGQLNNYQHLTNYSLNKDSAGFKISDADIAAGTSSKRTLENVYKRLQQDGVDIQLLKLKIADLIIKTLISVQPDLLHNYRMCQPNDRTYNMCFEILGFDVLIDDTLKPWLLEVNLSCSLAAESPLDLKVKSRMLSQLLTLASLTPYDREAHRLEKKRRDKMRYERLARGEPAAKQVFRNHNAEVYGMALSLEGQRAVADMDQEEAKSGEFRRIFPTASGHVQRLLGRRAALEDLRPRFPSNGVARRPNHQPITWQLR